MGAVTFAVTPCGKTSDVKLPAGMFEVAIVNVLGGVGKVACIAAPLASSTRGCAPLLA